MDNPPTLKENTLYKTDEKTKAVYFGLLMANIVIFGFGVVFGDVSDFLLSIPIIAILLAILFYDSEFIHVPPVLITIINLAMVAELIANYLSGYHPAIEMVINIIIGVALGGIGIIISYISLGKMPGFAKEKPVPIVIESFCVSVAIYTVVFVCGYYLESIIDFGLAENISSVADRFVGIMIGSALSIFYFFRSNGPMRKGIEGFLFKHSDKMGIEKDEKESLIQLIESGESFNLEFKSTIRMNLKTGEKDKRMEKAVLKSLVAFLNGDGGTLLVGVSDDGGIIGVDIEGFDNCDKMNLHIINLISSQIGDEFLPFIRFKEISFGQKENGAEKMVVRFDCKPTSSPVFLKDGKSEIYYVRSGPSSVEIMGSDLIKYVDNRRKSVRRKYPLARALSQPQGVPEAEENEE